MQFSLTEAQISLEQVDSIMRGDDPLPFRLKKLYWTLFNIHSIALANGLRQIVGDTVQTGPFKGMMVTDEAFAAFRAPLLLGCYEHELHEVFERVIAAKYARVVNIGCAVGYYAIGLARRMPKTKIDAFDISPEARKNCFKMAQVNGVESRVCVSGEFRGCDFENYAGEKTLVLMDIETAEKNLLDPDAYPALRKMDVIVELHDLMDPTISKTIIDRFAQSHTIKIVRNRAVLPDLKGLLPEDHYLDPFDHFLLGWEARDGRTPWGVFTVK